MKSQESLDEDLLLGSYAGMLGDPNYINTIVDKKVKQLRASARSMKMKQFLPWTIARLGVKEHESEVSFTDRTHLNSLGVGKQILLPHSDFQVGEPMDQGGTASSSAEVPRCLPSTKVRRMKQWKRHQPMAEEELDFEGDQMQVDEGSMLRTHILFNTQLFEDVACQQEWTHTYVPHVHHMSACCRLMLAPFGSRLWPLPYRKG